MRPLFRPADITEKVVALETFPSLEVGTFTFTAKGLSRWCRRLREDPGFWFGWKKRCSLIIHRELMEIELQIVPWLHVEDLAVSLKFKLREPWKNIVLLKGGEFAAILSGCINKTDSFPD